MTFSNNPEKLSLFGGGCNESATFSELFRLVWRTIALYIYARTQSGLAGAGDAATCSHVRLPGLHGYINADVT